MTDMHGRGDLDFSVSWLSGELVELLGNDVGIAGATGARHLR